MMAARALARPESKPNQNGEAGAERADQRQRLAQAHQAGHGRVGRGHRHVHVERALRRALDEPAHLPLDAPVAVGLDEADVAEMGVRVEAHGHRRAARGDDRRPPRGDVGDGFGRRPPRLGAHLDLGQEGLVVGPLGREAHAGQDPVGHVREPEGLGVDEQELLLEPDREGLAGAEAVLVAGEPASERGPPPAHGLSPSAARAAIRPNTSAPASPLA